VKVNVICMFNAHGLAKDGRLIGSVLSSRGHAVTLSDLVKPGLSLRLTRKAAFLIKRRPLYDVNVHVESCVPALFKLARRNVLVPNLEALRPEVESHLSEFDLVLCKSQEACTVLGARGLPVAYTSFSSPLTPRTPQGQSFRSFLHASGSHVAGGISVKGTAAVYESWRRHPHWPAITVTGTHLAPLSNLAAISGYMPGADYAHLQDRCGVHVCPSEMEGFGHYIAEPLARGAVVITTDGAPMNELVTADRGFLVAPSDKKPYMLGHRYCVSHENLSTVIEQVLSEDQSRLASIGQAAQSWFIDNDTRFRKSFVEAVEGLFGNR
jgi:hypothetical protein